MSVVHVLSGGAAQGVVAAVEAAFRDETGATIAGTFGAVGAMRDRLVAGEPCDVAILTAALIDRLAADGHVIADSARALGRVATGVAVVRDAPRPDVSTGPALASALRAATAIYLPDPVRSTAGIHVVDVLTRLGLHDALAARLRPFPNGATAMAAMAEAGDREAIGCTQVTEILYTAGVSLVDALPPGFGLETTYTAVVTTRATGETLARALVARLSDARSAGARRAGGFAIA